FVVLSVTSEPRSPSSRLRPVTQVNDAVRVGVTGRERQLARRIALGEQPRAAAQREREHEQMQLVDETVREQRAHERAAAADVEIAVDLVLETADRRWVVRPEE